MIEISSAVSSSMLLDEGRDRRDARLARRPPAALAGDQLVAVVAERADEDRLEDAVLPDRSGQLVERVLVEDHPRLVGVRLDPVDRDDLDAGAPAGVLGREQADDRGRELAVLGQATGGDGAEVRPGQGRSPPGRARDRCERLRTTPAYDVIGRPASGASPSFTVLRTMLLKTWWSPTTRSSSSMSRARFVRLS